LDEEKRRQVEIIGRNIKALIDANGMTNRDLASALGLQESSVGKWINGLNAPSMGTLQKVAAYFKVRLGDITSDHPPQTFADPNRRYLLDRIDRASAMDLAKLRRMVELIEDEHDRRD